MRNINLRAVLFAFLFFWISIASARVDIPPLNRLITDLTSTLSATEKAELAQTLEEFEGQKGSRIAVLIVPTTAPETIEQYSLRVARNWRLGRKNVDDGILLLVAKDDHALRIEVGYGLDSALNTVTSTRIIDEVISPRFKKGDFNGGITAGTNQIMRVINGEHLPDASHTAANFANISPLLSIMAIVVLACAGFLRRTLGSLVASIATGITVFAAVMFLHGGLLIAAAAGLIAALLVFLSQLFTATDTDSDDDDYRRRRRNYDDDDSNSSNSGSSGGTDDSGSGGGGGGSFGGSGASGKW